MDWGAVESVLRIVLLCMTGGVLAATAVLRSADRAVAARAAAGIRRGTIMAEPQGKIDVNGTITQVLVVMARIADQLGVRVPDDMLVPAPPPTSEPRQGETIGWISSRVDEVATWERALPFDERAALYNGGSGYHHREGVIFYRGDTGVEHPVTEPCLPVEPAPEPAKLSDSLVAYWSLDESADWVNLKADDPAPAPAPADDRYAAQADPPRRKIRRLGDASLPPAAEPG